MKLVNYIVDKQEKRTGIYEDGVIIDLNRAYENYKVSEGSQIAKKTAAVYVPSDMTLLLEGGEETLKEAEKAVNYVVSNGLNVDGKVVFNKDDVKLEAPVGKPNKIICVGHNYREHILEMKRELPENPVLFAKFNNTISGPEDPIVKKDISDQYDFEAEFAFVIGKQAKNVKEEDALDYVAGYTVANDVSVRDLQKRTLQWLQGKSVDGTLPLGPWLVTKDEVPDPHNLDIELKVNGETKQKSNTSSLVFNVNRLVDFVSHLITLEPGDILLTGTPGGVGVARDPQEFLQEGDTVTISIDQVGILENEVRNEAKTEVHV
ncbi:fumarylacetoacetate hydrolase family protein [Halobacillus sp. Marseille-P3879]|uniref:fumarylacetoacetate hydrolase family protein n=1 Tax=Halobacillus sp. Marseille-P3879 TaxID=2045014 RepID=UPI000C7CB8C7|nr:fumarylacetoacetate hydrolase family protein [Halobacillus sp. Marseille-P3879]